MFRTGKTGYHLSSVRDVVQHVRTLHGRPGFSDAVKMGRFVSVLTIDGSNTKNGQLAINSLRLLH